MRPRGSAEELERRRPPALELLDEGRSLHEVARIMGCAASSVMRWRDVREEGGDRALKVKSSPGRPPRLSPAQRDPAQRDELVRLLLRGTMAHRYRTELWTTDRIAEVIVHCSLLARENTLDVSLISRPSQSCGCCIHSRTDSGEPPSTAKATKAIQNVARHPTTRYSAVSVVQLIVNLRAGGDPGLVGAERE